MNRTLFVRCFLVCPILVCLVSPQVSIAETTESVLQPESCSYDRSEMLELDINSFDQDFEGGWRSLANRDGCKSAAADLIRAYIEEHNPQSTILLFHEAQMRAMAGQTDRALQLFPKTRKPTSKTDRIGWNHYVDATIAFLREDRDALMDAQTALARTPRPDGFNPVDTSGNPIELIWPPNLNVVDGFLECFEKGYDWAYNNCSRPLLKTEAEKK